MPTYHDLHDSPLGKISVSRHTYSPDLLFSLPRATQRQKMGIKEDVLPFDGVDIWRAYELSWLNLKGKPQVAMATIIVPATSPYLIESKSFKLYLQSFNQTKLPNQAALLTLLHQDLAKGFGQAVEIELIMPEDFAKQTFISLEGTLLDALDIDVVHYEPTLTTLNLLNRGQQTQVAEETLVSHLLRSNCLITHQPDWASVQIHYVGQPIDHAGLLQYLIGLRLHNEFHEPCVERIFTDILHRCQPQKLSVYAGYTRRGGLDINPWRTNDTEALPPTLLRHARQ